MSRNVTHKLGRTVKMCPYPCKEGRKKFHWFSYALCNEAQPLTDLARDSKLVTCKHCLKRLKSAEKVLGEVLQEVKP